ncbi:unnamed protein product, partial [Ectocarpus sp. 4 AP-2014]
TPLRVEVGEGGPKGTHLRIQGQRSHDYGMHSYEYTPRPPPGAGMQVDTSRFSDAGEGELHLPAMTKKKKSFVGAWNLRKLNMVSPTTWRTHTPIRYYPCTTCSLRQDTESPG